jgi:antirestriction protein ArdC
LEPKAHVRKGEERSLVVYADKIICSETDANTGEEAERAIPFMKKYTVFNAEQIAQAPLRTIRAAHRDRVPRRTREVFFH